MRCVLVVSVNVVVIVAAFLIFSGAPLPAALPSLRKAHTTVQHSAPLPKFLRGLSPLALLCSHTRCAQGNMGLRLPSMAALYRNLGVNIFMVSYRGYGRSEGTPNELGIKMDAKAVMEHVFKKKEVDGKRLLILGRSLGGAVGTYIASAFPQYVRGLILENTFTSIPDMVDAIFPKWISTMKWLVLRISWGSIDLIPSVTSPILFISGLQDELVPPEHMRKMHDAAVRDPQIEAQLTRLCACGSSFLSRANPVWSREIMCVRGLMGSRYWTYAIAILARFQRAHTHTHTHTHTHSLSLSLSLSLFPYAYV